jgi:hypothetical protein
MTLERKAELRELVANIRITLLRGLGHTLGLLINAYKGLNECLDEIDRLQAENGRLRDALERAAAEFAVSRLKGKVGDSEEV